MDSTPKLMLLAALVPAVVCCAGGYVMVSSVVDVKSRRARDFGDEVVRKVTANAGWDAAVLRGYGSEQFQKQYSAVELGQTVTGPPGRTLGAFRRGKGTAKVIDRNTRGGTLVDYQNAAEFDHGQAVVKMELVESADHKWSVSSFAVAPNLSH